VVRWLPVALVALGAVTGTVIIPGAVGLSVFFAGDQILNWVQDWYRRETRAPTRTWRSKAHPRRRRW
jgi:hypothetical protein